MQQPGPCWLLALAFLGGLGLSCSSTCDTKAEVAVRYTGGRTDSSLTRYETNAFDAPFLDFPAGRLYELPHGLKAAPSSIAVYLSFQAEPLRLGSSFSLAAGNEALIERVDAEVIWLRNDTCAEFFMRLDAATLDAN